MSLRFPGQYWDEETGTHYNFHRDYVPRVGRYTQSDPIGLNGGENFYLYAYSRPLNFLNATGLQSGVVSLGGVITIIESLEKSATWLV